MYDDVDMGGDVDDFDFDAAAGSRAAAQNPSVHGYAGQGQGQQGQAQGGQGGLGRFGFDPLDLDLDQLTGDLGMGMGLGDDLLLNDMMAGGTGPGAGAYPASAHGGSDALGWDDSLGGVPSAQYDVSGGFGLGHHAGVGNPSAAVPIVKAEARRGDAGAYMHGVPGASPATSAGLAGGAPGGRRGMAPPGVPAGSGMGGPGKPPLPPVSEVPSSTVGTGAGAGAGAGTAAAATLPALSPAEVEDGLAKFKKGFRSGNKDASINVAVRDTRLPFGSVLQVMWASKPRLQRRNVKTHPMRLLRSMLRAYMSRDNLPRTPQSQHLSSRHFFRAFLAGQPEPGTRLISLVQSMLPPHERIPAAIAQDMQLTFNLLVDDDSSDDSGRLTISEAVDAMYCATCDELMCYRGCRVRHHGSRSGGASTAGDVPMRARVRARSRAGSASAGAGAAGAGAGAPPLGSSPGSAMRGGRVDTRERNKKRTRDRAASRPVDPSRPQVPVAGCPATWLKPPLIAFQEYSGPTDVDVELMGRSVVDKIWSPPVARVQSCPMHYDALLFVTGEAPPLDSSDPHMTVDVFTKGKASVLPELTFDIYYEDLGNANPQETQLTVPSHDGASDQFRGPGGSTDGGTGGAGGRARKRQSTRGSPWDSWGGDPVVSNGTYRVFRSLCTSALDLLEHTARVRAAAARAGNATAAVASSSLAPVVGSAVEEACVALCRAMYCVAIAQYDPAAFWSSISDEGGVTLLHVAAALGCERVVNTMLQSGADATAPSVAGTPSQLAEARGFEDIAATLSQDPDSDESAMSSVNGRDVRRGLNFAGRELLSLFKSTLRMLRSVALPEARVAAAKRVDPAAALCRHLMRGTCVLSAMFEGDHTFLWGRLVSSSGWQLLHAAAALGAHTTVLGLYNLGADMWACPEARCTEEEIAAGLESQTPSPGTAAVVAAAYGQTALAQFLRPYPASVGARTSDSDTDAASAGAGNISVGSPPSRHMSLAERVRRASGFSADPIMSSQGKGSAGHGSAGLMSAASTAYPPTADVHHKLNSKRAAGSIGYGTVGSYAPSSQPYEHRSSRSSAASSTRSDKSANRDEYSMTMFRHSSGAFVVMILLGLAMLLPWNIIVFAVDYFQELYPHQSFEFLGAAAYIVPQLPVAVLMWRYGDKVSVITRLVSALVAQTVVLLAIPEVAQNVHDLSMVVCLLLIALSGLISQITISSTIGFASQLPPICTQAVMVGLGGTGLLGAIARIGTKAGIAQYAHSGLAFFVVGAIFVAAAAVGLLWLSNTPFTEYHMKKAQHRRTTSRVATTGPRRRVWAPLIPDVEQGDTPVEHGSWQHFSVLSGKVWAYAASAALVFFTTFVLWPGEMTNIPYKNTFSAFDDLQANGWWPLVLLTVFNVFDLGARCLPPKAYYCGEKFALLSSILRCMFFLPVFVYAASTHDEMVFNDLVAVITVALFAASNGYLATVALQCAPAKVPVSEKESTGFFMTLFLQSGSFMGTIAALALDRMHVHASAA